AATDRCRTGEPRPRGVPPRRCGTLCSAAPCPAHVPAVPAGSRADPAGPPGGSTACSTQLRAAARHRCSDRSTRPPDQEGSERMPTDTATSSAPMKLVVTGGAGYVGSVCAARLVEAGHDVTVVDDLSTGHADAVPDGVRFIQGDAADVAETLLSQGFDGVLHFAAKSLVGESMQDPGLYWRGNVLTSLRLLEAMRKHGTPRLVFSSTAATYGEPEVSPI